MRARMLGLVGAVAASVAATSAGAQPMPLLVDAFVKDLANRCGGKPVIAPSSLIDRIDLNGDGVAEWLVDASRVVCTPPRPQGPFGVPFTVFLGRADGGATPAFQRSIYAVAMRREGDGSRSIWLTLGGPDCEEPDIEKRCERRLIWSREAERLDLSAGIRPVAAPAKTPATSDRDRLAGPSREK